jgi:hypothetical protein
MYLSVSVESETDAPVAERPQFHQRHEAGARHPAAWLVSIRTVEAAPLAPDHPRTGPHPTD